jgi:hypothetical protein
MKPDVVVESEGLKFYCRHCVARIAPALPMPVEAFVDLAYKFERDYKACRPACEIGRGLFGRWYLFRAGDRSLAWSGSRWAENDGEGFPTAGVQLSNFSSREDAREYALSCGMIEIEERGAA